VVYIVSENTTSLTNNRLDAMFLDKPYTSLFDEEFISDSDASFFKDARGDGWGNLLIAKVQSKRFDANTIRAIMDEAVNRGYSPKLLLIDSPDHQRSIRKFQALWQEKGEVYLDNKNVAEEYNVPIVASAPLKAGSSKTSKMDNEMIAGAQDIARHVDFQIMFNTHDENDEMLNRARLVVTKNREYLVIDGQDVDFYRSRSLLMRPYDEVMNGIIDREQYTVYKRSPGGEKEGIRQELLDTIANRPEARESTKATGVKALFNRERR
jgi:hypothetical protein